MCASSPIQRLPASAPARVSRVRALRTRRLALDMMSRSGERARQGGEELIDLAVHADRDTRPGVVAVEVPANLDARSEHPILEALQGRPGIEEYEIPLRRRSAQSHPVERGVHTCTVADQRGARALQERVVIETGGRSRDSGRIWPGQCQRRESLCERD